MIGGKIIDFYTVEHPDNERTVKFLVQDGTDTCCVRAKLPETLLKEVKVDDPIWWHEDVIFLQVFGCTDVPFLKIGPSGGNAKTFYENKPTKIPVC